MKALSVIVGGILLIGTTFAMMPSAVDTEFERLAQQYVDEFPALSPVSATSLGDHRFDGKLNQVSSEARVRRAAFLRKYLDGGGLSAGSAYVYRYDGAVWQEEAKLTASDAGEGDGFGSTVAVSGDRIVVGRCAAVYMFVHDGTTWVEEQKFMGGCIRSVSIDGDTVIAGLYGAARVFQRAGGVWTLQQVLEADPADTPFGFGYSAVSISGDTIAVGHRSGNEWSGSVYVFVRDGSVWVLEAKLIPSDPWTNDLFGKVVSISGDHVLVGVPQDDDLGIHSGSAYLYSRGPDGWQEIAKLIAGEGAMLDEFGSAVAIDGDRIVIGASYQDAVDDDAGAAYFYAAGACAPATGDLDGDGIVGILDLLSLLAEWGVCPAPCPPACVGDIDGDCVVGPADFSMLIANWGPYS